MSPSASIFSLEDPGIRERWESLQKDSVIRTPFATLGYVEDLSNVLHLPVKAAIVTAKEDVAGLLFLEERKSGMKYNSPQGFTPFSGLAAKNIPTGAEIHSRDTWYESLIQLLHGQLSKTDLVLPPNIQDVRSFQWASWQVSPLYTYRLDVSDPDRFLSGWSEGAHRLYAKMKDQYELTCSTDHEHHIVQMCLEAYERSNRTPPLTSDQLEGLVLRQIQRGQGVCYTVHQTNGTAPGIKPGAAPSAGVVVLGEAPDAYYWVAGSIPGPAMTILLGKLSYELSKRGYKTFDLVGANTPSIAEFKRRFNPVLTTYFRVRHVRNRLLRIFFSLKEANRL